MRKTQNTTPRQTVGHQARSIVDLTLMIVLNLTS